MERDRSSSVDAMSRRPGARLRSSLHDLRRTRMSRFSPSGSMLVALLALVLAMGGTAAAASIITSKQIKDGTISTKDLSKKTISALKGKIGKTGPQGAQGPQGPQGAKGADGAAGAAGADGGKGGKGGTRASKTGVKYH